MHILLIHQAFAALDEPGGTRHHELARVLAAQGHRVTVIASPLSYLTGSALPPADVSAITTREESDGIRVIRTSARGSLHRSFLRRLFTFFAFMFSSFFKGLSVRHVDLVWGTSPPIFQGVTAWVLARLKGVPFLFEVRDLWPRFVVAVGVLKNPLLIKLSLWLERFLYRHADRLMVNSPGFLEHVSRDARCQVDIVPNGSDPDMFDPHDAGAGFRKQHGLSKDYVVLYAGAHGMSNDLGMVLEAARLLLAEKARIRFVFLGDGKEKESLRRQAREQNLTNVLFLPPIPKQAMASALAGADACLAILKPLEEYKTTYPNKVFDYMAAGRPVLLAIDGVIRQVVEQAECGVFCQPGDPAALADAVCRLAADPSRSHRMGLSGRKYLEKHFSRHVLGQQLVKIMEELIQENA